MTSSEVIDFMADDLIKEAEQNAGEFGGSPCEYLRKLLDVAELRAQARNSNPRARNEVAAISRALKILGC